MRWYYSLPVEGEGAMQISVESTLLTEGSQPPSQPHAWGKEQTEARLKY